MSGSFRGCFTRKFDCFGSDGRVQFGKEQRRANIILCLRGGFVWGSKLRLWGQAWVQSPAPPHTGSVTLGKFRSLAKPLFSHL